MAKGPQDEEDTEGDAANARAVSRAVGVALEGRWGSTSAQMAARRTGCRSTEPHGPSGSSNPTSGTAPRSRGAGRHGERSAGPDASRANLVDERPPLSDRCVGVRPRGVEAVSVRIVPDGAPPRWQSAHTGPQGDGLPGIGRYPLQHFGDADPGLRNSTHRLEEGRFHGDRIYRAHLSAMSSRPVDACLPTSDGEPPGSAELGEAGPAASGGR